MARVTGRPHELLPYDTIQPLVKSREVISRGLREIPLDAIVGSVGRYEDFTRSFLPRASSDAQRWANVRLAVHDMAGLPPIEVYKVGEVYFVLDGNHRVSVAREIGAESISAYVSEVRTPVPVSLDDSPDDLIIKARHAEFMEHTRLDAQRPDSDLAMTAPGQYRVLEEEIEACRRQLTEMRGDDVSLPEAAADWYDRVYLPVRQIIRDQGVLRDFPGRTEADLYVWLVIHQAEVEEHLGWQVEPDVLVQELAEQESPRRARKLARLSRALIPPALKDVSRPGEWRRRRALRKQHLFVDILVPVISQVTDAGWPALAQALVVARREASHVHGLHVLEDEADDAAAPFQAMQDAFVRRCAEAGVPADFAFGRGDVARAIGRHGRWADIVVINMAFPPSTQPLVRLGSGFRAILQRTSRPVLVVPHGRTTDLRSALLAYDASSKADEALYLAAYLGLKWRCHLDVVCVFEDEDALGRTIAKADRYLSEKGLHADFIPRTGDVGQAILDTAVDRGADLIVMGSYSVAPALELVIGSAVNRVLSGTDRPVLICR